MFPLTNGVNMTEYQIECRVERLTDKLDRQYMAGKITGEQYEQETRGIANWANHEYKMAEPTKFPFRADLQS